MKRIKRMNTDKSKAMRISCLAVGGPTKGPRTHFRLGYPCSSVLSVSSVFQRFAVALCIAVPSLANAEVTARDAWVRGTVPAQTSSGAFMTLTSTTDAKVVSAKSPVAKIVEIHESMMHGGVNHMHEVEAVAL